MSYLVFCTFDLKNATSSDYETAYAALEKLGLQKVHKSDKGKEVVIPTTAAMGELDGDNAGAVRDHVAAQIKAAFAALRLKSEIFVTVGGNWAWGSRTT
ncbi:hypothetical protein LRS03_04570 [Rhizobacter sp. J219]|uniref:hypothetical protein n=1 Tax=Rhizobacter sp. J219 TaxID=2898430 RepID=UPI002150F4AA|nr:hypothetical protein [Rhizobacter sp. J219]MCR5882172.1 hypothetical protein [Rhizobacter sp. J219]